MDTARLCFCTDSKNEVWWASPSGVAAKVTPEDIQNLKNFKTWQIVATPENYELIIKLQESVQHTSENICVWVGAASICPDFCNSDKLLSGLALSCVHNNLHNRWHPVTSKTYNNYLLLSSWTKNGCNDLTKVLYNSHCLSKAFNFIQLTEIELAIDFIDTVVDPRWFLRSKNQNKLSKLESYFQLLPRKSGVKSDRIQVLLGILDSLPAESPLFKEFKSRKFKNEIQASKKLLHFLARNWLSQLMPFSYFDPDQFFSNKAAKARYIKYFEVF
jgi:hypothetical protein